MAQYDISNLEEAKELASEFMRSLKSENIDEVGGIVQRGELWILPSEDAIIVQRKGVKSRYEDVDYVKTDGLNRYDCAVYSQNKCIGRFRVG